MNSLINIENKEGNLIVSSREVAKNFEKEHFHVTRDIENIIEMLRNTDSSKLGSQPTKVGGLKTINEKMEVFHNEEGLFIESEFEHKGNIYKEYLLTRDGFTLLAIGFTGSKALGWKLKYIEAFNKMEKALKEVYHISETAIVNNVMAHLETRFFPEIDNRLKKYEENYRPTHANKIDINNYIKSGLGEDRGPSEVDLVKQRVLLMLDAEAWQDIPYKKLIENMRLIDESIRAVKSFRTKSQLSLFED